MDDNENGIVKLVSGGFLRLWIDSSEAKFGEHDRRGFGRGSLFCGGTLLSARARLVPLDCSEGVV